MAEVKYSYDPGTRGKYRYGAVNPKTSELIDRAIAQANASLLDGKKISGATIVSGGQPAGTKVKGQKARAPVLTQYGGGTGSTRHDFGGAADIKLLDQNGNVVSYTTTTGKNILNTFARAAAQVGATGIGFGPGYMGMETIHVGFGPMGTWGSVGTSGALPNEMQKLVEYGWSNPVNDPVTFSPQDAMAGQIARLGFITAAGVPDVAAFQKAMGLPVDGVLGPQTMTAAYMANIDAQGKQVTSLAETISPTGDKLPSFAEAQAARNAALGASTQQPNAPGTSLEARDEAYAARQAALKGVGFDEPTGIGAAPGRAATFDVPTRNLTAPRAVAPTVEMGPRPTSALSMNAMVDALTRKSPNLFRDVLPPAALTGSVMSQPSTIASARVNMVPVKNEQTVIGNPAGIDMANRSRMTPLNARTMQEAFNASRQSAPVARATTDMLPGKSADDRIAVSASSKAPGASLGGYNSSAAPSTGRANISTKESSAPKAPGASLGGYNPGAAPSSGRANISTPASVRSAQPVQRATTDTAPGKAKDDIISSSPARTSSLSVSDMTRSVTKTAPSMVRDIQPVSPTKQYSAPAAAASAVSAKPTSPAASMGVSFDEPTGIAGPYNQAAMAAAINKAIPTPALKMVAPISVPATVAVAPAPVAPAVVMPKPLPPLPPPINVPTRIVTAPVGAPGGSTVSSGGTYTTSKGVTVQKSDMIGGKYGEASYGRKQSDGSVTGTTSSGTGYRSSVNEKTGRREYEVGGRTYGTDSKGRAQQKKVLCTHYKNRGWLPKAIWLQDGREYKLRPGEQAEIMRLGYHWWAVPTVRFLERQTPAAKVLERILWPLIRAWSYEAAYRVGYLPKGTIGGKVARAILEPSALLIGKIITFKRRLLHAG